MLKSPAHFFQRYMTAIQPIIPVQIAIEERMLQGFQNGESEVKENAC